jgi:sugar lactone lactonase YvrE
MSHTGHRLYISETNTNNIHEYPLNTNWDISTAQNRTNSFDPNNITYAYGLGWSSDGMKLWAAENRYVREYSASSAYSLSGMSATPSASFDMQDLNGNVDNGVNNLNNQEIRGIAVSSDGNRLYLNIRGKGVYKLTMTSQNTIADGFEL